MPFTLPYLLGSVELTKLFAEDSFLINDVTNSIVAILCFDLIFVISGALLIGIYFKLEN